MDGITLKGTLRITRVRSDVLDEYGRGGPIDPVTLQGLRFAGVAELRQTISNMVVDLGLSAISRLVGFGLAAPDVTNGTDTFGVTDVNSLKVDTMKFGNLNSPTAPAAADNDLEDPTPLTSVTPTVAYPGNYTVRWSGLIAAGLFTGDQVTEEALFIENDALFARTTFSPEAIVAGFGVQFDHDFVFARA